MFLIDVPALANPVAAQASHPEMEGIGESRYPVRLQLVSPRWRIALILGSAVIVGNV